jgi:23S rRNA C2498 (ribose-2'-O)-methylase RlmM
MTIERGSDVNPSCFVAGITCDRVEQRIRIEAVVVEHVVHGACDESIRSAELRNRTHRVRERHRLLSGASREPQ